MNNYMNQPISKANKFIWYLITILILFTLGIKTYNLICIPIPLSVTQPIEFYLIILVFLLQANRMKLDKISILMLIRLFLFTIGLFIHEYSMDFNIFDNEDTK